MYICLKYEIMRITFETAKLAKEKGFSNGGSYAFIEYSDGSIEERTCYYTVNNLEGADLSCKGFTVFERSSQSSLQTWLRNKHNIDIQPICNYHYKSGRRYHYKSGRRYHLGIVFINSERKVDTIIIKETDKSLDVVNRHYNSYEEALEEGLEEALKLII